MKNTGLTSLQSHFHLQQWGKQIEGSRTNSPRHEILYYQARWFSFPSGANSACTPRLKPAKVTQWNHATLKLPIVPFSKDFIEQTDDALDSRRVHHDTDAFAHGLRRQVLGELGPDGSGVAVGSGDLAPDDTEVRLLRLVGNWGLVLGLKYGKIKINQEVSLSKRLKQDLKR